MRVFMLGWEFPPFISGGLGTACYGLTKAMDQLGMKIIFVLPKVVDSSCASHVKLLTPNSVLNQSGAEPRGLKNVKFYSIESWLRPYASGASQKRTQGQSIAGGEHSRNDFISTLEGTASDDYSRDMYTEVHRYAALATELAAREQFDVIHAHDWMTYPAGWRWRQ